MNISRVERSSQGSKGTIVTYTFRLVAADPDSGEGGRVSYRILSGNDFGLLELDPETGVLTFNEWSDEQLVRFPEGSWVLRLPTSHEYRSQSAS